MIERWYVVVVHVALLASIACNHTFDAGGSSSVAPPTKKGMDVDEVAGKAVPDPYRWLEGSDPKTGTSLEISAWQEKQHAYAETYLATLPGRSVLERQLKAMLETKVSVPVRRGQRSFFLARAPGQDRSVLMLEDRTSRGDAGGTKTTRRVLVDPAQWPQRTDAIGPWSVSRDGRFVAYGVALNGADVSTVRVLDVESGKDSAIDVLPRVVWEAPHWSPDGRLLYYNTLPDLPLSDPSRWLQAVMVRHEIGKPASSDLALSKPSLDGGKLQFGQVSHDGRHFFSTVGITGNADTPVFWKRLDAGGDLVLISTGLGVGRHSVIDIVGSRLIMVTTAGAANGRVVTRDLNQRDSGWQVLVPEQSAAVIQGASVIGGRLVVTYTRHAASEIWIVPLDASGPPKPLSLPGVGSVLDLDTVTVKGEPDSPDFGFLFSSLSTPPAVYRASVDGGAPILEMQAWDNSPLRPTAFERVEFPSKDGTRVGMFVLRRTDLNPEPRPLLVFAYGGFGVSMLPWEHVEAVPWVQAGGIFALVNTRGGSENGEDWHRQAMGANKRRAFEDLDAAVEHLVARGDAARGKAVALGISNGGLVVTATSLLWPEHYAAVIAQVPITDLVRSHLIGQGFLWTEEFGVKNYENSAYHMALVHGHGRPLPRTLVTMAREDDRTTPIHAAKYVAALQAIDPARGYLWMESNAGHGGGAGADRESRMWATLLTFAMSQVGLTP